MKQERLARAAQVEQTTRHHGGGGANALGFVAKLTYPVVRHGLLDATPAQVGELFSITALLGMASAPSGSSPARLASKPSRVAGYKAPTRPRAGRRGRASAAAVHRRGDGNRGGGSAANALAQESAPKGGEARRSRPKTAGDLAFLAGSVVLGLTDDTLGSPGSSLGLVAASAAASALGALVFLGPTEEDETRAEA